MELCRIYNIPGGAFDVTVTMVYLMITAACNDLPAGMNDHNHC